MNIINTKTLKKEAALDSLKGCKILDKKGCSILDGMKSCDLCNGKLIDTKDIIIKNGKTFTINVKKCIECEHSYSTLDEAEKLRKEVNPTFLQRIKTFFNNSPIEHLNFFKGRVL